MLFPQLSLSKNWIYTFNATIENRCFILNRTAFKYVIEEKIKYFGLSGWMWENTLGICRQILIKT